MFYYGQIIEYIDGTRDLNFENARKWCDENNAHFLEIEPKENGVRQFKIVELTLVELQEEVRLTRASLYQDKVDPLMAEYTRKKTFNLFDEGEEEALLAEIEAKVAEIKEENPYPEVEEATDDNLTPIEEAEVITQEPSETAENEEENSVEVITPTGENEQAEE